METGKLQGEASLMRCDYLIRTTMEKRAKSVHRNATSTEIERYNTDLCKLKKERMELVSRLYDVLYVANNGC